MNQSSNQIYVRSRHQTTANYYRATFENKYFVFLQSWPKWQYFRRLNKRKTKKTTIKITTIVDFRKGMGTIDMVFTARRLQKKCHEDLYLESCSPQPILSLRPFILSLKGFHLILVGPAVWYDGMHLSPIHQSIMFSAMLTDTGAYGMHRMSCRWQALQSAIS